NSGVLTASTYGTGIAHFSSAGVISSSAVNLNGGATEITGVLPISNGGSPFDSGSGAIFERISTQDLLLGSNSTASAKFGFLNVNSGTPTASISATGGNSLVLDANGQIQTQNAETLTLGGVNTGDINFYTSANSINSSGNLTLGGTTITASNLTTL